MTWHDVLQLASHFLVIGSRTFFYKTDVQFLGFLLILLVVPYLMMLMVVVMV